MCDSANHRHMRNWLLYMVYKRILTHTLHTISECHYTLYFTNACIKMIKHYTKHSMFIYLRLLICLSSYALVSHIVNALLKSQLFRQPLDAHVVLTPRHFPAICLYQAICGEIVSVYIKQINACNQPSQNTLQSTIID